MRRNGRAYRLEPASIREPSRAFLEANPLCTVPTAIDGTACLTESIAIMQYIMGRYGPTELALGPDEPGYADYLQFLVFGEAALAMNVNPIIGVRFFAPETEKDNWSVRDCAERYVKRMLYVEQRLGDREFIAGRFSAADISLGFALGMAEFAGVGEHVPQRIADYRRRLTERAAYQRAAA